MDRNNLFLQLAENQIARGEDVEVVAGKLAKAFKGVVYSGLAGEGEPELPDDTYIGEFKRLGLDL